MRKSLWWGIRGIISAASCPYQDPEAYICGSCPHYGTCMFIRKNTTSEEAENDFEIYKTILEKKILWFILPFMKAGASFFLSPLSKENEDRLSFLNDSVECEEFEAKKENNED